MFSRRGFFEFLASIGAVFTLPACQSLPGTATPLTDIRFSGVYPHLAFHNDENECGIGAVVVWAGRLWAITYGPHLPFGSSDKLYEINDRLSVTVRPESVGGTHANRLIHRESRQLFIGLHAIDADGTVRTIAPKAMPGRQTGTARHLVNPHNKIYYATMEEGLYEVDVRTLDVKLIQPDGNTSNPRDLTGWLPGAHGKGLYTGQRRLIYSNNGEAGHEALQRADIESGVLAEWDGSTWSIVRRKQFTEVTGPGGISGSASPADPIWATGWDHRSAILMLRDGGTWRTFRLPKASHTYDGAHGWHTEWPRIREIGNGRYLMTQHGMFWDFPAQFSSRRTGGLRPLSTYLKIVADFCEWRGSIVFGADDAAKSEFARNPIPSKGTMVEQSNSNLWFVDPGQLEAFGAAFGRGGPWVNDAVEANTPSDPYYFAGFDYRMVYVRHDDLRPLKLTFEIDRDGAGNWTTLSTLDVPAAGSARQVFDRSLRAEWIRAKTDRPVEHLTLVYHFANRDERPGRSTALFDGLARPDTPLTTGVLRTPGGNRGTLEFAARHVAADGTVSDLGQYEIGPQMILRHVEAGERFRQSIEAFSPEPLPYRVDPASVVVIDIDGRRWRLPRGTDAMQRCTASVPPRTLREVVTERSLLNVQGHLYELPRANSGGFAKVRPVATSELLLMDLASWRGMLVLAGVATSPSRNRHIIRSDDGRCALWFGVVDDLWQLGKPRGDGGPWRNTKIRRGAPSDPYLMTGYDDKELTVSHASRESVRFRVEVDITGDGIWAVYDEFVIPPGGSPTHRFAQGFNAYWVRLSSSADVEATAQFRYF